MSKQLNILVPASWPAQIAAYARSQDQTSAQVIRGLIRRHIIDRQETHRRPLSEQEEEGE